MYDLEEPQSRSVSPDNSTGGFPQFQDENEDGKGEGKEGLQNQDGLKILPFEFVALEACLEAACSCLENEVIYLPLFSNRLASLAVMLFCLFVCIFIFSSVSNQARTLELEAHPALDKLTSKISTLNLERVRQIKSRLVAITGRVQKVG